MTCPNCGTDNLAGAKFCSECGTRLAVGCPACGASNAPGARFCNECGTKLGHDAAGAAGSTAVRGTPSGTVTSSRDASPSGMPWSVAGVAAIGTAGSAGSASRAAPATERRHVSVLFADLVGFTTLAADRDSEAVRDLLSRYFEIAREIVERYGGTIEKFIGDAVMAVWGTPIAQEDDPERAVRTALDLLEAVRALDSGADGRGLEARAGVLTGEAAVTVGATGQGMVAGDLVNTASRLQSVAPPGTVLVGEATFRAANRAVAFEAAGDQLLRGKTAPVPAWRALRVVAKRGGEGRAEGMEAPFVGRDDELRLLKDFFHATSRERRARLISVTGQGGIGKSRLAWEFLKYIDGVLETVYWHQGRSPAYGEGITFWALGEMVRRRAGLAEGDDERTSRDRIGTTLAEFVPDETERRWIEPALLFLLGFGDAPPGGRDDLFAAWRTFFERIASVDTTVLVFEDLQWADAGLLDFIDHLLEWSTNHPIYVVTLARPELLERRSDWGAGRRNFVALSLPPLSGPAMRELLAGLVPGLPSPAVRAILDRADGIPLYAVETVRMLVAEGRLELVDGTYRPTADLTELAVPESLHALIAARLDALDPIDRSLLQDCSVLGQTFSVQALAAVSNDPIEGIEPRLRSLARREILVLDTDPRSPERGQYGFTQALIREVAYSTLSRRERRARHLAAARYFESLGDEEVGVLATHYVDAYLASPDGPEADPVAAQARIALRAAADRASALGSHEQAVAYLRRALDVTPDPGDAAEMLERVGSEQLLGGRLAESAATLRRAVDGHRSQGDLHREVRASVALGDALNSQFDAAAALEILEGVAESAATLGDEPLLVRLNAQIARSYMFSETYPASVEWADRALVAAETLGLIPEIAHVLITKGLALGNMGRLREGVGLLETGERLATAAGLTATSLRSQINQVAVLPAIDPRAAVQVARQGSEVARRLGMRHALVIFIGNGAEAAIPTGDVGWALPVLDELLGSDLDPTDRGAILGIAVPINAILGRPYEEALQALEKMVIEDGLVGGQRTLGIARIWAAVAEGDLGASISLAFALADISPSNAPFALSFAALFAICLRDHEAAQAALDRLTATGVRGPTVDACRRTAEAGLAGLQGRWPEAVTMFQDAIRALRDLRLDLDLTLAWTCVVATAPEGDPLAVTAEQEARAILERINLPPFTALLDRLVVDRRAVASRGASLGSKPAASTASTTPT